MKAFKFPSFKPVLQSLKKQDLETFQEPLSEDDLARKAACEASFLDFVWAFWETVEGPSRPIKVSLPFEFCPLYDEW